MERFKDKGTAFRNPTDQSSSMINLISSDQLLRNQSPLVINPSDLSERLIATRLIRRIDHEVIDPQDFETYREYPKLSTVVREISWTHKSLIFLYFFEVPNWHLKLLYSLEDDPSSLCERHPKCPQKSWGIKSWDSSLVLRICIILKLFQMHLT
jgi:hypothetical protein